jgi:hypothetical protein
VSDAPLELQLATAQAELRNVYRERAHLVAYLAAVHPSSISHSDPATPEWPVVTVETEHGQMSWHIAPDDVDLFDPIDPETPAFPWDGHSTDEKYQRLRFLTEATHVARRTPQEPSAPAYPYADGDVTVLGPELFASADKQVICWRGENYRIPEPDAPDQEPAEDVQAPAEAPKRRGRPRKTAQAAAEASQTVLEA